MTKNVNLSNCVMVSHSSNLFLLSEVVWCNPSSHLNEWGFGRTAMLSTMHGVKTSKSRKCHS